MNIQKIAIVAFVSATVFFTSCKKEETNPSETNPAQVNFSTPPATSIVPSGTVDVITENNVRYHVLTFGQRWTSTIVESKNELTLVDVGVNFDPSFTVDLSTSGAELRAYADAINKPISVIITHDHVDHFLNLTNFNNVPVYAEANTAALLMADTNFTNVYHSSVTGVSGSRTIGGFVFEFGNFSGTEAPENGFMYIPSENALFTGDLTSINKHPFIRDYTPLDSVDELSMWISDLNDMKSQFRNYKYVFVGHVGYQTNIASHFDQSIAYLTDAQGLIKGTKPLTAGGIAQSVSDVVNELRVLYPNYGDGGLLFALPNAFYPGDPGAHWF